MSNHSTNALIKYQQIKYEHLFLGFYSPHHIMWTKKEREKKIIKTMVQCYFHYTISIRTKNEEIISFWFIFVWFQIQNQHVYNFIKIKTHNEYIYVGVYKKNAKLVYVIKKNCFISRLIKYYYYILTYDENEITLILFS